MVTGSGITNLEGMVDLLPDEFVEWTCGLAQLPWLTDFRNHTC